MALVKVKSNGNSSTVLESVEIGAVTLENNLALFSWGKNEKNKYFQQTDIKYRTYSYNS